MSGDEPSVDTGEPGRRILVVGANGAIGSAVARRLVAARWSVIGTHRGDLDAALSADATWPWVHLNVEEGSSVRTTIESVEETYGLLAGCVYCPGLAIDGSMLLFEQRALMQVTQVNFVGAFLVAQAVARSMMVARRGSIVFIGSVAEAVGNPGLSVYAATKASLRGLSTTLAVELGGYGLRVNVVAPGPIETPMTRRLSPARVEKLRRRIPLRQFGAPEDVAHAVAFLLSDEARYITGQTLYVDGGLSAS